MFPTRERAAFGLGCVWCRLSLPVRVRLLQIIELDQALLQGPDGRVLLAWPPAVGEMHLAGGAEPPVWTAPGTHLNTTARHDVNTSTSTCVSVCVPYKASSRADMTRFIGYLHMNCSRSRSIHTQFFTR